MEVILSNVSKRFGREAVLTGASHVFEAGSRTALLGPNGSGKSTLLQLAAGALIPTSGSVAHALNERPLDPELVYRHISIAAPYLNLYEDLSLRECVVLHARFKPLRGSIAAQDVATTARLDAHLDKPVRNFSSGMKQRLKLALAVLSDTPLLLLDEPTTNLDAAGTAWFRHLLEEHLGARTLLVASNRQADETFACTAELDILRWKS